MAADFFASNTFNTDGVRTRWVFAFAGVHPGSESGTTPYLFPADVHVEELYTENGGPRTRERTFSFVSPNEVLVEGDPIAAGRQVRIFRKTEIRFPLVDYRDKQTVSEADLDLANRQAVFLAQETLDAAAYSWTSGHDGSLSAQGAIISDVADGYMPMDAVNARQLMQAQIDTLNRTIHVAEGEAALGPIPDVTQRAGKVLSFNAQGVPVVVAPASGSATDLATALASANGVSMIGNAFDKRDMAISGTAMEFAGVQVIVPNVAALRLLDLSKPAKWVGTQGYHTPGDGGQGVYLCVPGGTQPDNGGTVLRAVGGNLILSLPGRLNIKQWGCKGDGVTDDTVGYMAAVASKLCLWIPPNSRFIVAPIGPINNYPGAREPNRTSGAQLSDGQTVLGAGDTSVLEWKVGATVQAFFGAKNCVGAWVQSVKFVGGYSSIIIDAASDYSVRDVGVIDCTHQSQLIGFIGGLQTTLAPDQSKLTSGIYSRNCRYYDTVVHGVLFSNSEQYAAVGNNFKRLMGGYCIDSSHGSRGGVVALNNAHTCLYFWKAESSLVPVVPGGVMLPEKSQCRDTIVTGNTAYKITGESVLINSWGERILLTGNCLHGATDTMVRIGQVTGGDHDGSITLAHNTLICQSGGADTVAVRHLMNTLLMPLQMYGNQIVSTYGVWSVVSSMKIHHNVMRCVDSCVVIFQPGGRMITQYSIDDNDLYSSRNIAISAQPGGVLPYRAFSACRNYVRAEGVIYTGEVPGFQHSNIDDNKHYWNVSGPTLPVIGVKDAWASSIQGNRSNCPAAASRHAVRVYGVANKSIIMGNLTTCAIGADTPDADTTRLIANNIATAPFLAQT